MRKGFLKSEFVAKAGQVRAMGKERELRRGSANRERLDIRKQTWKHKACLKLTFISVYSTNKIVWKD